MGRWKVISRPPFDLYPRDSRGFLRNTPNTDNLCEIMFHAYCARALRAFRVEQTRRNNGMKKGASEHTMRRDLLLHKRAENKRKFLRSVGGGNFRQIYSFRISIDFVISGLIFTSMNNKRPSSQSQSSLRAARQSAEKSRA